MDDLGDSSVAFGAEAVCGEIVVVVDAARAISSLAHEHLNDGFPILLHLEILWLLILVVLILRQRYYSLLLLFSLPPSFGVVAAADPAWEHGPEDQRSSRSLLQ